MGVDSSRTALVLVLVVQMTLASSRPGRGRQPSDDRRLPSDWTAGSTDLYVYVASAQAGSMVGPCIVLGHRSSLPGPSTAKNTPKWSKFKVTKIANCILIS
ncbi:hypothetical protein HOY82DRAFT_645791 [Tuber indicum]|nr:hypothetical protein HOY82DRAFT_645791 [Tuber indicum]